MSCPIYCLVPIPQRVQVQPQPQRVALFLGVCAGSADEGGLPRYRHYQESEKVVGALLEHGRLNLTSKCMHELRASERFSER